MIYEKDKENLKKYRHLIASLISYSIGYFTPLMAYSAIKNFQDNTPYFCEWYMHIAGLRGAKNDADYLLINRDTIRNAIKNRNGCDFKRCFDIVDGNIAGYESLGASWF